MEKYSEYKDSGVQWLGQIPGHWEIRPFKSNFTLGKGLSITKENLTESGINVINYGQIHSKLNLATIVSDCLYRYVSEDYLSSSPNSIVNKDDFIFADTSEDVEGCGNFVRNSNNIITFAGYHTIIARSRNKNYSHFLSYLFISNKWKQQIWVQVHGVKVFSISRGILNSCKIILPPLSEQEAIVAFLDEKTSKIDKLVANKEKEIALLQEMKQRVIADAVTKGLNPDVKFKETGISWLPQVPEHWEVLRLSSKFTGEVTDNRDYEYKTAFKFFYGSLVPKNEVGDLEEYKDTYIKYSILQKGDIVVNGLNLNYDFNSQRIANAPYNGIITSAYVVCRPRKSVNSDYYTWLFKAMDSMKLFHGMGTGIRLTLSFKELKKQLLPVPPLSEQEAIVTYIEDRVSKIDALTQKLQNEIECAKEYKQRLISDAVTGQIKVC